MTHPVIVFKLCFEDTNGSVTTTFSQELKMKMFIYLLFPEYVSNSWFEMVVSVNNVKMFENTFEKFEKKFYIQQGVNYLEPNLDLLITERFMKHSLLLLQSNTKTMDPGIYWKITIMTESFEYTPLFFSSRFSHLQEGLSTTSE